MRIFTPLIAAALGLAICLPTANAAMMIFEDDFESYADTAEMNAVWNGQAGAPGTLSNLGNPGQSMEHPGGTSQVHAITQITPSDAQPIIWEFDLYDTLTATRNTGGLRSAGAILEMGRNNSIVNPPGAGTVSGYGIRAVFLGESQTPGGPDDVDWITFSPNLAPSEGWHHFKATIGASSILFELDINDDGSVDATRTIYTSLGGTKFYDQVRFGGPSNVSSTGPVRFDNLSITQVPEPATLALVALGFVGLAAGSRRRAS